MSGITDIYLCTGHGPELPRGAHIGPVSPNLQPVSGGSGRPSARVMRAGDQVLRLKWTSMSFKDRIESQITLLVTSKYFQYNKHCEILVSCSDEERNCMQAQGTACKLM